MLLCISLVYSNLIQPIHTVFNTESTHIVDLQKKSEDKNENEKDPIEEENEDKDKIKINIFSSFFSTDHIDLNIHSTKGSISQAILDIFIPPPELV